MTESVTDHTLEALMAIPNGSLRSVDELYPYFGVDTVDGLADAMVARLGYDRAYQAAQKVNVMGRMKLFFDVKLVEAKHRHADGSKSAPSGLPEAALAVGGGIAVEAGRRATELLNGSEQRFDGVVDFDVLLDTLRTKFAQTGFSFRPVSSRADDTGSCQVLDESGGVLLTFTIKNESRRAPIEETPYNSEHVRSLGSCRVVISPSDVSGIVDQLIQGVDRVDEDLRSGKVARTLEAVLTGGQILGDVFSRADLPQKIATEIATVALRAAQLQEEETQTIRRLNERRAEEINSRGTKCAYCGRERLGNETECASCGAFLPAMAGSLEQIEADKQKLGQRGFTFS